MRRTIYSVEQLNEMPIGSKVRRVFYFYPDGHHDFEKIDNKIWTVDNRSFSYVLTSQILSGYSEYPSYIIAL